MNIIKEKCLLIKKQKLKCSSLQYYAIPVATINVSHAFYRKISYFLHNDILKAKTSFMRHE